MAALDRRSFLKHAPASAALPLALGMFDEAELRMIERDNALRLIPRLAA